MRRTITILLLGSLLAVGSGCNRNREILKERTARLEAKLASVSQYQPADLTYNFRITVDRAKRDMLLIGPENEDIHIGVIGRRFYPTESSLKDKANWPIGEWTCVGSPPDSPSRYEWRYHLILKADGTVTCSETELFQGYDDALKPKGKRMLTRILRLSGVWSTKDLGSGQIIFDKKTEERPNQAFDTYAE